MITVRDMKLVEHEPQMPEHAAEGHVNSAPRQLPDDHREIGWSRAQLYG